MPSRNVFLTEHLDGVVATEIASGQFNNASEVVREALRLFEQRQAEDKARIEWLRSAAQHGIDQLERGEGITYASMDDLTRDIEQFKDEVIAEVLAEQAS